MKPTTKDSNKDPKQTESAKKKRTLKDFLESEGPKPKRFGGSDKENDDDSPAKKKIKSPKTNNDDPVANDDALSSDLSSPPLQSPGLTASGSSLPDREVPTPNTPSRPPPVILTKAPAAGASNANNDPSKKAPEKRKRTALSAEEKAAKTAAEEAKKAEREAAKQKKAEEAAKAEELKRQKQAEKEAKKREKEDELAKKKREKEEKEKKKREKEEEAARKARSQITLTSMFNLKSSTSKKDQPTAKAQSGDATTPTATPTKAQANGESAYKRMFKDFYLKEHVKLAPASVEMDDETRGAQTKILEEYINGTRTHTPSPRFNALEVLELPFKVKRGRAFPSVKKIMAEVSSSESQTSQQANHLQELLNQVPVISIKFFEDVRPPYIGTISDYPNGLGALKKLARNPIRKDILPLTYDYDSEAEWQEEDGEDIEDLDDEDDEDEDEDMADFLDDADDVGPSRMVFSGGMEPESSGLCWENRKRGTTEPKMYKCRMEFILDKLEHHHSIDPFSTAYWETPKPAKSETGNQKSSTAAKSAKSSSAADSSLKPKQQSANQTSRTSPTDAFQALNAGTGKKKSQQPLPLDLQEKLKALVRERPTLSKVGVIELFMDINDNCNKNQVKNAYSELIVRVGKEHKVKGE
ncbi:putative chromatin assembly complex, subunit p90 [Cercophora samala]|uniref:Chromatin assembly complex, subunit p90 n=1 Tax=Cercophora samala TaxID=330535 RepID=A0AA40DBJ4_9PEZI|nr:putative chromatin assembly complex, subunit p90 [Cercophora samala]